MSFIDAVPKATFSCNCGVDCFGSLSSRTEAFSYSISRFSEYSIMESSFPCLVLCAKHEPFDGVNQEAVSLACAHQYSQVPRS